MFEWCRVLGPVYSILAFYGSLFSSMSSLSIIVVCVVIFLAFALVRSTAPLAHALRGSAPSARSRHGAPLLALIATPIALPPSFCASSRAVPHSSTSCASRRPIVSPSCDA
eukprot:scaffold207902_cov27-Tisochrysis_lutea.AAC.4